MTIAIIGLGVVGVSTASQLKDYQLTVVDNNVDQLLSFHKRVGEFVQLYDNTSKMIVHADQPQEVTDVKYL